MDSGSLIACQVCDLLNRRAPLAAGDKAYCRRCGALLYSRPSDSLDRTLALTLGAAILMIVANAFPIVDLEIQGNRTSTTLFGSVQTLYDDEMRSVAALVFATTILMPAMETGTMLYMLLPLKFGWVPKRLAPMFRLLQAVRPWGMVEVFMLGTLVSLAKLGHIAHVVPGIALWSFGVLMFLIAAAAASFDPHELWARVAATERKPCDFVAGETATEDSR